MTEKRWKRTERKLAAILGGRRVPVTGRARGDAPDIQHHWLSVEVKSRQKLPEWLREALAQARACATETMLPIVVLHEVGVRHSEDIVMMTLHDFWEWFGDVSDSDHSWK